MASLSDAFHICHQKCYLSSWFHNARQTHNSAGGDELTRWGLKILDFFALIGAIHIFAFLHFCIYWCNSHRSPPKTEATNAAVSNWLPRWHNSKVGSLITVERKGVYSQLDEVTISSQAGSTSISVEKLKCTFGNATLQLFGLVGCFPK